MSNAHTSLADEPNTFYARFKAAVNDANAKANANTIANAKANAHGCRQEENSKTHSSSPSMISAFNTIILSTLTTKPEQLGLGPISVSVDLQFPKRQTTGNMDGQTCLNLHHPQHWSPPGLCSEPPSVLIVHDCVATTNSTTIIRFTDNMD
ncbi:hypothetical protein QTP70_027535 [Hemibagrus guttatus]|uniref:Uncharacterized protein n=1 Tax=Hemibagrus guttatus TaxID=175788 RepID=A0AAE0QCL4_9TELE|nr:hypothetical protein QTP70_027535 [Hemibagrus guttatus]